MRAALVTGAAGFVGSSLARELLARGVRVRALVRDPARAPGLGAAEVVRGDVTDPATLAPAAGGMDTVFHCAALATGDSRPLAEFEAVNVRGSQHVFAACRGAGVERVVHVSTVSIYGHTRRGTVTAESLAPNPETPYGITKLAAEREALAAHAAGLPVAIARPMWVYGMGSPGMQRLFELIRRGGMVTIGGGANAIQPIAIEDLVAGLIACAEAAAAPGEAFNLAGPRPITTAQMCADIAAGLGVPPPRRDIPMPVALALAWGFDHFWPGRLAKPPINRQKLGIFLYEHAYAIDKAASLLGWRPRVEFADGAARVARAMLAAERAG